DPEDDAPRLIYADWLDEQGESERAEFIRVQIALARMDEDDERRPDLEAWERELLAAHEEEWGAGRGLRDGGMVYARGLPELLNISVGRFLAEADGSLARCAAHRVRFLEGLDHIRELAECRHLAQFTEIEFWSPGEQLTAEDLEVFASSPHLGR